MKRDSRLAYSDGSAPSLQGTSKGPKRESIRNESNADSHLVAQLQYGCGLRINEGVKLRVKDFNFDAGILTVRGKGEKTRTVPIPQMIVPCCRPN